MMILRGEYGHIKSRRDNHNRCIKRSSCSRESTCSTCSSWSDKTWKLAEERRTCASRKWDMAKKKKRSQKATKKNWMGSPLHTPYCPEEDPSRWQLQGYLYPEACKSTGQPATGHQSTSHRPFAQWTRKHHRPANDQMGIAQEFSSQSVTGHRPSSHRSLDRKYQHGGKSIFTSHQSTSHRSPVIRLYINLHLVRLMPWAWSSLIITQKEFYYPWNRTWVICPIPVLL